MSGPATILIVDDEAGNRKLLDALLRAEGYLTLAASSGEDALGLIAERAPDLILLDVMMPRMDGYQLATILKASPATSNIPIVMVTARNDRSARMASLQAGVEEFLSKPIDRAELWLRVRNLLRLKALTDAEKVLLQQTVLGSIRALVDILAIVNPAAFGRAGRIERLALELAAAASLPASWELEAAALLSQLGHVSLPAELMERASVGKPLSSQDARLLDESPKITQRLIGCIPRLENVGAILAHASRDPAGGQPPAHIADYAAVLLNVLEFDALTSRGESVGTALETLRARSGPKDAALLTHLAALQGIVAQSPALNEILLRDVRPGMVFIDDVHTQLGTLLVSRGYEISLSFVDRMRNFAPGLLEEKVRVRLARPAAHLHSKVPAAAVAAAMSDRARISGRLS